PHQRRASASSPPPSLRAGRDLRQADRRHHEGHGRRAEVGTRGRRIRRRSAWADALPLPHSAGHGLRLQGAAALRVAASSYRPPPPFGRSATQASLCLIRSRSSAGSNLRYPSGSANSDAGGGVSTKRSTLTTEPSSFSTRIEKWRAASTQIDVRLFRAEIVSYF